MDKRTLFGSGAAGAIVLIMLGGTWLSQRTPASPLDAPLPPGAAQIIAGNGAGPAVAPAAPIPNDAPAPVASAASSPVPSPTPPPEVVVFVTGAVKRPGVYHLKPGARLEAAIFAAGGFKPNAQTDAINLADLAQDGDKIQVGVRTAPAPAIAAPRPAVAPATARPSAVLPAQIVSAAPRPKRGRVLGERVPAAPSAPSAPASADTESHAAPPPDSKPTKFKNPGDGIVNLNTADEAELQKLPGVGPSMAAKILAYRQEHGPFADISQLDDVKGIGPKTFAKMQPFLSVK